jgi:hypothetical protein
LIHPPILKVFLTSRGEETQQEIYSNRRYF